jgi:hypothetical protein
VGGEQRNHDDDGGGVRKPDSGNVCVCRVFWKPRIGQFWEPRTGHIFRRRADE